MHFCVMVFGDNVEQQMAPFQETNMGPIARDYMEKVDRTDEVHELFQERTAILPPKRWSVRGVSCKLITATSLAIWF